jgi:predicted  nucleic acid-binding Zn-ribbon protein
MAKTATKTTKKVNIITVEDKLKALYQLQCVDSNIDNIRVVRGELPLEIQDLEDDISGLNTRIEKYNEELTALDDNLAASRLKKKRRKSFN